jgi:hypothetical protein
MRAMSHQPFQRIWIENKQKIDLDKLKSELVQLRDVLEADASTPQRYVAIGNVALAEKAAESGDGPEALRYLKAAGHRALEVATMLGAAAAVEALELSKSA